MALGYHAFERFIWLYATQPIPAAPMIASSTRAILVEDIGSAAAAPGWIAFVGLSGGFAEDVEDVEDVTCLLEPCAPDGSQNQLIALHSMPFEQSLSVLHVPDWLVPPAAVAGA